MVLPNILLNKIMKNQFLKIWLKWSIAHQWILDIWRKMSNLLIIRKSRWKKDYISKKHLMPKKISKRNMKKGHYKWKEKRRSKNWNKRFEWRIRYKNSLQREKPPSKTNSWSDSTAIFFRNYSISTLKYWYKGSIRYF